MAIVHAAYLSNYLSEACAKGTLNIRCDTEAEAKRIADEFSGAGPVREFDGRWFVEICISDINDLLTKIGNGATF